MEPQLKYIEDSLEALSQRRYADALRMLDEGLNEHLTSSAPIDARLLAKRLSTLITYLEFRLQEDFGIGGKEPPMAEQLQREHRCSFCGNEKSQDRKLLAGPVAMICDQCIKQCSDAIGMQ